MVRLDVKSAADRIRTEVTGKPDIPAEARHALAFAKEVCAELGIDPDPVNMQAVAAALQRAGIEPHFAEEYPKMLTDDKGKPVRRGEGGPIVVFNDAAEEAAYKKLEPVLDAPKVVSTAPSLPPEDPPKYEPPPKALADSDDMPRKRK